MNLGMNLFTESPCPHCHGSGKTIDLPALQRALTKSGKSLQTVAKEIKMNPGSLSRRLSGERRWPQNQLQRFLSACCQNVNTYE